MTRTTILLPTSLRNAAIRQARRQGVSMGALIRQSLERTVSAEVAPDEDAFLADRRVARRRSPGNVAAEHDRHLYGNRA
jgi:hypothetical protein